jgi:hypothetical protein
MARWDKAYGETNGWYGLCQWEDEVDGESIGRMCYRRTTDVYCQVHNRQLERESERKRKAEEREAAAATRASTPASSSARARPPRLRRDPRARPTSNWAAYKAKHPARVAFYASSTWRNMRDRQLRDYPDCVVCGQKAGHADHVVSIALGGSEDGQLQSMCAKHHHEKTVRDSHAAAKRAATRRKELKG